MQLHGDLCDDLPALPALGAEQLDVVDENDIVPVGKRHRPEIGHAEARGLGYAETHPARRGTDGDNVAEVVLGQLLVLDLGELDARPLGDDAVGELPRAGLQREKTDAPPAARHVPGKLHRERRLADGGIRAEHDEVPRLGG